MAGLRRLPIDESLVEDVTAVDMDDKWILVGQVDGFVAVLYRKNGAVLFIVKISDSAITALLSATKNRIAVQGPFSMQGTWKEMCTRSTRRERYLHGP